MSWCIYKHINKINGKVYIGQTCQKPEERWGKDGCGYKNSGNKFYNAIKKYGWDNFAHEIIEENIVSKEQASEREKYWIAFYNSFLQGYNSDEGGSTNNHLFKPVYQLDQNYKIVFKYPNISLAEKAVNSTSISACCHRYIRTAGGFYWCFCEDYSENWEPIEDLSNRTEVYQISPIDYSIIQKYDSILDASRSLSGNPKTNSISNIRGCLTGENVTAYGFYWCKAEEWHENWKPRQHIIPNAHAVVCWDTGEVFDSPIKVKEKYNILVPNVIACCTGKNLTAQNKHFCYLEDYEQGWRPREGKKRKRVICIETNEVFPSASEADRFLKLSIGSVSKVCCRKRKTAGGYHWEYVEEGGEE